MAECIPRECALCGKRRDLELHHIFGGNGRRNKSDKLGLVVYLCRSCHYKIHNGDSVHMQELHEFGQRQAMADNEWSKEDFIREFGRSYI